MKKSKKFLAMFMALIMCLSFNANVFADDGIPAGVEKHTITIDVPVAPTEDEEPGIQPQIWGNPNYTVGYGTITYTQQFIIPDRYFAFEAYATDVNGNAVGGEFTVDLYYKTISTIGSLTGNVTGETYKLDWLNVYAGEYHLFRIVNSTATSIKVTITYYSWA